ncbi:MAG: hypothetical protein QOF01_4663 [Thermomicrobiales bacterium]|nr:hypothetical protein [Thermomicrobiales bacterium]
MSVPQPFHLAIQVRRCHTQQASARVGTDSCSIDTRGVAAVLDVISTRRKVASGSAQDPRFRSDIEPLRPLLPLIGLLVIAVAVMTDLAAGKSILSVDVTFGQWLQSREMPIGSVIAAFGNAAGSSAVGIPLALGAVGVSALARRWSDALFLFGLLLVRGLNTPLKEWASSPRPPGTLIQVTEAARGLGFPSGHSMGVVLLAGGLAYVACAELPSGRVRVLPCVAAILVILSTGYGRIETGAHWPSDVLGGFLWGTLLLLVAIVVRRLITAHYAERTNRGQVPR